MEHRGRVLSSSCFYNNLVPVCNHDCNARGNHTASFFQYFYFFQYSYFHLLNPHCLEIIPRNHYRGKKYVIQHQSNLHYPEWVMFRFADCNLLARSKLYGVNGDKGISLCRKWHYFSTIGASFSGMLSLIRTCVVRNGLKSTLAFLNMTHVLL